MRSDGKKSRTRRYRAGFILRKVGVGEGEENDEKGSATGAEKGDIQLKAMGQLAFQKRGP